MVLECSSALKGPFTALFAVRFCYGCCLNGPFQGRIVGGHGTQGFADFALGCRNEPFRLKDGLILGTTGIANSATSKLAQRAGRKRNGIEFHAGSPCLRCGLAGNQSMTVSPPSREPIARQEMRLMLVGTNRTEPSIMPTSTPPVWALVAVVAMRWGGNMHDRVFGPETW